MRLKFRRAILANAGMWATWLGAGGPLQAVSVMRGDRVEAEEQPGGRMRTR